MEGGYSVNPDQLRSHAGSIDSVRDGFGRIKAASAFIAGDDQAYGILCSWMPAILRARHTKQDELFDYVEENLQMISDGLRDTADAYTDADAAAADGFSAISRSMTAG